MYYHACTLFVHFLQYACGDESLTRNELAAKVLEAASLSLNMVNKLERQRRAALQKMQFLEQELKDIAPRSQRKSPSVRARLE